MFQEEAQDSGISSEVSQSHDRGRVLCPFVHKSFPIKFHNITHVYYSLDDPSMYLFLCDVLDVPYSQIVVQQFSIYLDCRSTALKWVTYLGTYYVLMKYIFVQMILKVRPFPSKSYKLLHLTFRGFSSSEVTELV